MPPYRAFYETDVTAYAEGGSYPERACGSCSMVADQVAHPAHLSGRDTSLAFVSRAPQADIQGLKARHGWAWTAPSERTTSTGFANGLPVRP